MYQVIDERPIECGACGSHDIARTINNAGLWGSEEGGLLVCLRCGHKEKPPVTTVSHTDSVAWVQKTEPEVRKF